MKLLVKACINDWSFQMYSIYSQQGSIVLPIASITSLYLHHHDNIKKSITKFYFILKLRTDKVLTMKSISRDDFRKQENSDIKVKCVKMPFDIFIDPTSFSEYFRRFNAKNVCCYKHLFF